MDKQKVYCRLWIVPLGYLLLAGSLAALLAYPVSQLLGSIVPYPKLVNKGTLLMLLLGLYPCMKHLGFGGRDLGLIGNRHRFLCQLGLGLALGVVMLGAIVALLLAIGVRVPDPVALETKSIPGVLAKSLLVGVLVASLEEPLFRGLLLSGLQRYAGAVYAIVVSAVFYAALHFMKAEIQIAPDNITLWSGFEVIVGAFEALLRWVNLDSFLALFWAGVFLACVRLCVPYSLGYCIGLHAGWVFVIKVTKALTDSVSTHESAFLVGSYDGVIGYLAALWLFALTGLLMHISGRFHSAVGGR